jgi:SAM-dependent methyltransferase
VSLLVAVLRRVTPAPVRRSIRAVLPPNYEIADRIIERTALTDARLAPHYDLMSDEDARMHFGEVNPLESRHYRSGIRLFHAWKLAQIRERLGVGLTEARILDVGDSDGLLLRDLGKPGIGFNISEAAIRNIRSNGIEAVQGDAHNLPFQDGTFDVVLSFETIEHVESQHAVLLELARVCRPGGRAFVSVPWVPRTMVHPRNHDAPRGEHHAFELSPDDFAALVTHTPFRVVGDAVCELFAAPRGIVERLYLWRKRREYVVAGTFRAFQFFELELPLAGTD